MSLFGLYLLSINGRAAPSSAIYFKWFAYHFPIAITVPQMGLWGKRHYARKDHLKNGVERLSNANKGRHCSLFCV